MVVQSSSDGSSGRVIRWPLPKLRCQVLIPVRQVFEDSVIYPLYFSNFMANDAGYQVSRRAYVNDFACCRQEDAIAQPLGLIHIIGWSTKIPHPLSLRCSTSLQKSCRASGSNPVVGSSKNYNLRACSGGSARASTSRRFMPPERSGGGLPGLWLSPLSSPEPAVPRPVPWLLCR